MSTWREACPTWAVAVVAVVLAALASLLVWACNAPPLPQGGLMVEVIEERTLATLVPVSDDVVLVLAAGGAFNAAELEYALKAIARAHRVYGTTAVTGQWGSGSTTWALVVHVGPLGGLR